MAKVFTHMTMSLDGFMRGFRSKSTTPVRRCSES